MHECYEKQKDGGKGCKPEDSINLGNTLVKDPYEKYLLPWGLDHIDEIPIVMDSNEALHQIKTHKLSIKDPRNKKLLHWREGNAKALILKQQTRITNKDIWMAWRM